MVDRWDRNRIFVYLRGTKCDYEYFSANFVNMYMRLRVAYRTYSKLQREIEVFVQLPRCRIKRFPILL